jgi:hypothetical protein
MGWEFTARWIEDADVPWQWVWRRVADDSGAVMATSRPFANLDACIDDARVNGFDDDACSVS